MLKNVLFSDLGKVEVCAKLEHGAVQVRTSPVLVHVHFCYFSLYVGDCTYLDVHGISY